MLANEIFACSINFVACNMCHSFCPLVHHHTKPKSSHQALINKPCGVGSMLVGHYLTNAWKIPTYFLVIVLPLYKYGHISSLHRFQLYGLEKTRTLDHICLLGNIWHNRILFLFFKKIYSFC